MNKKTQKIIFLSLIIFSFFIKADFALALTMHYPDITAFGQRFHVDDTSNFPQYFCYFFGLLQDLAVFVTLIVMALGGIYYLVSYGRGRYTSEAKEWIKAGISGFLIVICAYLIIYTINPNLNTCRLGILANLNINPFGNNPALSNANVSTYKEIPIGILTEKLLTRVEPCYEYDQEGNPVWYPVTVAGGGAGARDKFAPDKDRAKCIALLIDGAQKKARVIAQLADKINSLMNNECDCHKYDNCQSQPNSCQPDSSGSSAGTNSQCNGICTPLGTISCSPTFTGNPYDDPGCCNPDSGIPNPDNPGKNYSVKYILENGPIDLSYDVDGNPSSTCPDNGCCTPKYKAQEIKPDGTISKILSFRGLDEFRCDTNKECDPNKEVCGFNGKQICSNIWTAVSTELPPEPGRGAESVIDEEKWDKLTLWQQLTFFKEQIDYYKNSLKQDVGELDKARA